MRHFGFLAVIQCQAGDDRNFANKAVNWALREIGKRNRALNAAAIAVTHQIKQWVPGAPGGSRPTRFES
jgi:3-methyladenine DNA glycosylase AlkD